MTPRSRATRRATGILLLVAGSVCFVCAEPAVGQTAPRSLTRLAELREIAVAGQRTPCRVAFEGVVLVADERAGRLVLQDASGAAVLHTGGLDLPFRPGDRIRVDAPGELDGDRFRFTSGLELFRDGRDARTEPSAEISLRAGRYALRVDWFMGRSNRLLDVQWEGPELPRQRVPNAALFRLAPDSGSETSRWRNGLDFRAYRGAWRQFPNFRALPPAAEGIAEGLECNLAPTAPFPGLAFSGFLAVPRDGRYTFRLAADGGARLALDTDPPRWEVIATNALPAPRAVTIGQRLGQGDDLAWSRTEGRVRFLAETSYGLEFELGSAAGGLNVRVTDAGDIPRTLLLNSRVQVTGACQSTFTADGERLAGTILVPGPQQVEILEAAPVLWQHWPVATIGSLTAAAAGQPGATAHVRGRVRLDPDHGDATLEDETGRLKLQPASSRPLADGSPIEALGRLYEAGGESQLRSAVWRIIPAGPAAAAGEGTPAPALPLLTMLEEVKGLSREEAGREYPVRIQGVVTALMEVGFFLQDSTWSVYVNWSPPPDRAPLQVGDFLEIEGSTYIDFAPNVLATRIVRLGAGRMPQPLRPTWDQLVNGSVDTQYIEIEGVIVSEANEVATLLTRGGRLNVHLIQAPLGTLARCRDARVRLRGCFMPERDPTTQQIVAGRIYLANGSVTVDEPAIADPFSTRLKSAADLTMFDAQASALHRVRLQGVVIHARGGEYFLADSEHGFRLVAETPVQLQPGDLVDAVGYPRIGGPSPVLQHAVVRRTGRSALPHPRILTPDNLLSEQHDAVRVRLSARLLSARTDKAKHVFELQSGTRSFTAHLSAGSGEIPAITAGSLVELTGAYAGQGGDRLAGRGIDSFELLLDAPADIVVVQRPSWWTARRMVTALALLALVSVLSFGWITSLRRQVERQTRSLKSEIEERKRAEEEVARIHRQLLTASHQAGMAEVATNVLHNVGNVLNSVNVSASVIADNIRRSQANQLSRLAALVAENAGKPDFLVSDAKGRQIPAYLQMLGERLAGEQRANLHEMEALRKHLEHIECIVAMQQDYARLGGVRENIHVREIVEDALKLSAEAFNRHRVRVERDFAADTQLLVEKHKLLQILVNLLQNARHACATSGNAERVIRIRIAEESSSSVRIQVVDNGVGIAAEHLPRIFSQGFTTRKDGHGFGLHGCVLAARELEGTLAVHSDGLGTGATFTLRLPLRPAVKVAA